MGHPVRVHVEVIERTLRGCSLRSYPRLLSGDAFSVNIPLYGILLGVRIRTLRRIGGKEEALKGLLAHSPG